MKTLLFSDWIKKLERNVISDSPESALRNIADILDLLNLKKPEIPVITITGTNGKGTCAALLESIYCTADYQVGCFTSPHLFNFNERIRINKIPVGNKLIKEAFEIIYQACEQLNIEISYFAYSFLSALLIFKNCKLNIIILEVGIGGKLDCVNLIDPDISLITSIELDHCELLGKTREAIAIEKAGVMRKDKITICGDPNPPKNLAKLAKRVGARLIMLGAIEKRGISCASWRAINQISQKKDETSKSDLRVEGWRLSARRPRRECYLRATQVSEKRATQEKMTYVPHWGSAAECRRTHPRRSCCLRDSNYAAVYSLVRLFQNILPCTSSQIKQGIDAVKLPGRLEWRLFQDKKILCDVSHNPSAVSRLKTVIEKLNYKKCYVVFGCMKDKDYESIFKIIAPLVDGWFLAELPTPRSAQTEKLKNALNLLSFSRVSCYDHAEIAADHAIAAASESDLIIVFGSFVLVSMVMKYFWSEI